MGFSSLLAFRFVSFCEELLLPLNRQVYALVVLTRLNISGPRIAQMLLPLDPLNLFIEVLAYQAIELYFQASNFNNINFAAIAYFDTLISIPANILKIISAGLTKDITTFSTMVLPFHHPKLDRATVALLRQIAWSPFCYLNIAANLTLIVFLAERILDLADFTI